MHECIQVHKCVRSISGDLRILCDYFMNNECTPYSTSNCATFASFYTRSVCVCVCVRCARDELWTRVIIITNCDLCVMVSWITGCPPPSVHLRLHWQFMVGEKASPQWRWENEIMNAVSHSTRKTREQTGPTLFISCISISPAVSQDAPEKNALKRNLNGANVRISDEF